MDLDNFHAFGSYTTVHLDNDHKNFADHNVTAVACVYLCNAHHFKSKGHVVWDYVNRRKLVVPTLSSNSWNYFPMRTRAHHISDHLTFIDARVDAVEVLQAKSAKDDPPDEIDPTSQDFPNSQVKLDVEEQALIREEASSTFSPDSSTVRSTYKTRQYDRMRLNIGAVVRRVFFINGTNGPTDFFQGTVRSITPSNKYYIVYADNDDEEMSERDFKLYHMPPHAQVLAHLAKFGGDKVRMNHLPAILH
jgi:hypothetical protein